MRSVRRLATDDSSELVTFLRRGDKPSEERLELALRRAPAGTPPHDVIAAVLGCRSREHGIAELNEILTDFSGELAAGDHVPKSAARIALASGAVLAIVEVARKLPTPEGVSPQVPLVAFALGLAGAVISAALGRSADEVARRQKDAMNELVRLATRALPEAPPDGARVRARGKIG